MRDKTTWTGGQASSKKSKSTCEFARHNYGKKSGGRAGTSTERLGWVVSTEQPRMVENGGAGSREQGRRESIQRKQRIGLMNRRGGRKTHGYVGTYYWYLCVRVDAGVPGQCVFECYRQRTGDGEI